MVDALGLEPSGLGIAQTANGRAEANVYMISIGLMPELLIEGVTAMALSLPDDCDALIGMDIINLGDFSVTNYDGRTCMSFRIPSMHHIDYTINPHLILKGALSERAAKVQLGRNEPCHCGSGKKYKNCHGKK